MIHIIIIGACGRMGKELIKAQEAFDDIQVVGGIESKGHQSIGKTISGIGISTMTDFNKDFDCAVDFSNPESTIANLEILEAKKKPVVIGTTGFNDDQIGLINKASASIPIFIAPNMAYGINVLINHLKPLVKSLSGFDIELLEIHHKRKKDAPSGTACRIVEEIKKVRPNLKETYCRQGQCGPREDDEIGITSIRGGDVYGVHRLLLLGPGEEITISHRALSRSAFVFGALKAVRFLVRMKPGLYSMADLTK
ncbi:MAG TPA: 4-hydroxy-tetrahydrodipicolinate reductase [bacterium (Candidatus Stahlbacteria)]|nr:4-hydroxy-tetrahydrodipicolinate reductase [Candidatus Stahlbacteria bacterium]